jgi:hypothetical protein
VTLSDTQIVGRLTIKTDLLATDEPVTLSIKGSAKIGAKDVVREAVPCEDRMQAFLWRHLVPAADLKALVFDPNYEPRPKRVPPTPPSAAMTNSISATVASKPATTNSPSGTNTTLIASASKPKFTKQQVAGRLRELKRLYEDGLLTDDFYLKKVAECDAAQ